MKKIALLLSILLTFSFFTGVINAAETTREITVTQDFESDSIDTMYWTLQGDAAVVDGKLTNDPGKKLGLSGIAFNYVLRSNDYCEVSFDLQSVVSANAANHTATFIGLRLGQISNIPTTNAGLWLTFANNKIGMRTGAWAKIETMTIPYSFETERRVYIRDNYKTNTVRIYVDNDKGVKTLVANVVLDGCNQALYGTSTTGTPYATNVTNSEIPDSGITKIWSHYNPNYTIDNIAVVRRPYTPTYVSSDPLLRRDTYSDTWVATDDLERVMPTYAEAGAPEDKKIGIFYFLWHTRESEDLEQGITLYDHYQAYLDGGLENVLDVMKQGQKGYAHFWGQSAFGYYLTRDEWIIRKHANMLTQAGVDFIFFDCTNGSSYYTAGTKQICDVYRKMRDEGQDTPQIVFCMGDNSQRTVKQFSEFWSQFYEIGLYEDLWFYWDGKPLILCRENDIPDEYKEMFTRRDCWAFNAWTNLKGGVGRWPWIAEYPQIPGKDFDGTVEQMAVAAGFHSSSSIGRSYHNKAQETAGNQDFEFSLMDTLTPRGLCFEEQWSEALRVDPPLVMITGWNEWWAGRWPKEAATGKLANTTIYADENGEIHNYVDNFNPEFSRDIEPMSGGFGDNYYYQMIKYVRQFRGVRPIPAAEGQRTIDINAGFKQWEGVWPEYYDTLYDTTPRDDVSFTGKYEYKNYTGRNDIDIAKVSKDTENVYFYVKTVENITAQDSNWMYLYIDVDQNHSTGWEGYDYLINRSRTDGKVSVEKNVGGAYKWENIGYGEYLCEGNQLHISVAGSLLGGNITSFDFKWADNSDNEGDITKFMSLGDAAPDSRFNFRYTTVKSEMTFTDETKALLDNGAVVMAINKNIAYSGNKKIKIDSGNTSVKPQVVDGKTYVPLRFLSETLGKTVEYNEKNHIAVVGSGEEEIKVNLRTGEIWFGGEKLTGSVAILDEDRTFLPLRSLVEMLDQTVAWDERGIIVVGQGETVSQTIMDELYRKI